MKSFAFALSSAFLLAAAAFATPITYVATLSGPAESPPNTSPGTGYALITIDNMVHTLMVQVAFSGLMGNTTASHIHCCTITPFTGTANIATETPTFENFPLGVTHGSYTNTFNLALTSSFNSPFVAANGGTAAGAEAALSAGLASGRAYLNIHTTVDPGGEIRGFLVATPEPATFLGAGLLLAGLLLSRRRK